MAARPAALGLLVLLSAAGPVLAGTTPPSSGCDGARDDVPLCASAGRPLSEALQALQSEGLRLIFSSDLVRPDMIVDRPPRGASLRQKLDRLLAPFGLAAVEGPGGTLIVIEAADTPATESADGRAPATAGGAEPPPAHSRLRERVEVGAPPAGDPASRTTLTRDDFTQGPNVGDDAGRTAAALPGMVTADRSARLGVRGGERDETLVLLDGLRIDEPYHMQNLLDFSSLIDADAVGRADVLTGILPAEYGDRTSGVMDLSTLDPGDGGRTSVGLSLINTRFMTEGSSGDGGPSWLVSARSWHPDAVLDFSDPNGEDIHPAYNDLLGKMSFALGNGSSLSAHLLASRDGLEVRGDPGSGDAVADDEHRYAWINWSNAWTPRLLSQTQVSGGRIGRSRRGVLDGSGVSGRIDDVRSYGFVGLKQDWLFVASGRGSLKWGLETRRLEGAYEYRSDLLQSDPLAAGAGVPAVITRNLALDPAGLEIGAYFAALFRPAPALSVEVGGRRDRQTLTHESETSPRINLAWELDDRSVLRAGWGRFHQPQGYNDLAVEDGVTAFLPAERSDQYEIGFEHRFVAGPDLRVAAYRKEMNRIPPHYENLFDPFVLFPEAEADRVRVAPQSAAARGLEIDFGSPAGKPLTWRVSYTLASAEDRIDGVWVPRSRDQRHTFGFRMAYSRGGRWDLALAGIYHSGWPTTEVGAVEGIAADGSPLIQPILGARNAERLPAYHRLDARLTRRYHVGGGTLGIYLDVTNLYGRENVCCVSALDYLPQPDGSVKVDRKDGLWLQRTPVAGLIWDF